MNNLFFSFFFSGDVVLQTIDELLIVDGVRDLEVEEVCWMIRHLIGGPDKQVFPDQHLIFSLFLISHRTSIWNQLQSIRSRYNLWPESGTLTIVAPLGIPRLFLCFSFLFF
mgnify:FL=1